MKSIDLYKQLEKDFITIELRDEWSRYMTGLDEFLTDTFKQRSMGLVCDFAEEINKVYTAVFPTVEIMQKILDSGTTDAMLFLHHPSIWDIRRTPTFYQMIPAVLESFKANRISLYNLHVPLDNYGDYSTSKTLADALSINIEKPFVQYRGGLCGVIGKTKCKNVEELNNKFSEVLGHSTRLYLYGDSAIMDGRIAVVAGGGNYNDTVVEMIENDVRVLITGISAYNNHSLDIHQLEQANHINVLGGTHYSTEKFACQKMCAYFQRLGLASSFIEGEPIVEDM